MKNHIQVWQVSFNVDIVITEKSKEKFEYSPCHRFIEGCLMDLQTTHGLICKNVKFKFKKLKETP